MPYLNSSNLAMIAAKTGEYKDCDVVNQRALTRRGFLKFQVELSTKHQLTPGFFLDISRGRKEWIKFQYFCLSKFCYKCGHIGHDKSSCLRETIFACPPEGEAVMAYASVLGTPGRGTNGQNKRKGPVKGVSPKQTEEAIVRGKLLKKVIRVKEKTPGSVYGNNLKVVDNTQAKGEGSRTKRMTRTKATAGEIFRGRRTRSVSPLALADTSLPIYAEEIGLAEELMGPAQVDKFEPTPTLFLDPEDVSNFVHECPPPRKRKASLTLIPYVQRTEENTREFSQVIREMPGFSPAPNTQFKMGAGASSSSTRGDTKRRRGAG
uniref:CCHC-type domain-containing protein n=1 Tax=Cannabis sativa TaxID=3483 RepID=A0A803NIA4_CANSA